MREALGSRYEQRNRLYMKRCRRTDLLSTFSFLVLLNSVFSSVTPLLEPRDKGKCREETKKAARRAPIKPRRALESRYFYRKAIVLA